MNIKSLFRYWLLVCLSLILLSCTSTSLDNSNTVQISQREGNYVNPQWSPDGQKILFQFSPPGTTNYEFVTINADGSQWQTILDEGIHIGSTPHWYQDQIGFVKEEPHSDWRKFYGSLIIYDLANEQEQILSTDHGFIGDSCWSEENDYIVVQEHITNDFLDERTELNMYQTNGNKLDTLIEAKNGQLFSAIACSQESLKIAVIIKIVEKKEGYSSPIDYRLEIIDIETRERTEIFRSPTRWIDDVTWSPDGQWLAVRASGTTPETKYQPTLFLIAVDGTQTIEVATPITPVYIDWSPIDNRLVATSLDGIGQYSMHVIDLTAWLVVTVQAK